MTDKTPKIFHEITPGEYVDINSAIDRHHALHGVQLEADTESTRVSSALTGETKTVHTTVGYGLWMSPAAFSSLIKILNTAPVNGDPLQAIVNLYMDTTANEAELEAMVDYLGAIGCNATLENVAAAYLHEVKSNKPLLIDVVTDERREYVAARVLSKTVKTTINAGTGYNGLSYIALRVPGELVVLETFKDELDINDFKGETVGNGDYRIIHALEPGGHAPLGGFILERIKKEEN